MNQLHALYGTDITLDELREDGVDLADREALVAEFQDDARDVYAEKQESFGLDPDTDAPLLRDVERYVILQIVDRRWREHLENMEYLREGIHLRSMAQKDPLTEYRAQGPHHLRGARAEHPRGGRADACSTPQLAPEARQEVGSSGVTAAGGNGDLRYEHETSAGRGCDRRGRGGAAGCCARNLDTASAVEGDVGRDRTREGCRVGPDEREARPQRPVLVRVRQEVQEVPRRLMTPGTPTR